MKATFYGFEAVRKALMASQMALDVTSQNVSNVNTEGYTRQSVNLASLASQTGATQYARTKGDTGVGQGVDIVNVTQNRDQFLDARYRKENAQYGKWDTTQSILGDVENVLDETTTDGLNARLTDFYKQLQSYSTNSDSIEYATNLRSSAQKVVDIFNQYSKNLTDIQNQQVTDAQADISEVNRYVDNIAQLNAQIQAEYVQGITPNELLDTRNLDIDKLSGLCGVSYETNPDGQISLMLGNTCILDSQSNNQKLTLSLDSSGYPVTVKYGDGTEAEITGGNLAGYLGGLNGEGIFADADNSDYTGKGVVYFQKSLNALAKAFADNFNNLNDSGGLKKLFDSSTSDDITAQNIKISDDWMSNAQYITNSTSGTAKSGSNDNLLRMVNSMDSKQDITSSFTGTFEEYATAIIGDMSTEVKYDQDMKDSASSVLDTISNQRESVMGVSTDEEAINMVKYQKSYNAAARLMTAMDEMLDTLITKTGQVGR